MHIIVYIFTDNGNYKYNCALNNDIFIVRYRASTPLREKKYIYVCRVYIACVCILYVRRNANGAPPIFSENFVVVYRNKWFFIGQTSFSCKFMPVFYSSLFFALLNWNDRPPRYFVFLLWLNDRSSVLTNIRNEYIFFFNTWTAFIEIRKCVKVLNHATVTLTVVIAFV